MNTTVLLTGASGHVAKVIRPYLVDHFGGLVLSDLTEPDDLAVTERFVPADLTDLSAAQNAAAGVDAVVHLAGLRGEESWDLVLDASIRTTINALEAARLNGVKRFVFASSNHAIGYYPRTHILGANERVLPDSRYGVAKAFGEAAMSLYADKYGLKCMSIRIGTVIDRPRFMRELSTFHHPEDLAQLITIGVENANVRNDIVFGLSENERSWWDNSRASDLGYRPVNKAEDHLKFAIEGEKHQPIDPVSDKLQGGCMSTDEFDGDAALIAALLQEKPDGS